MRGTGGDPVSGIFERLTPTVGVTFFEGGGDSWGRVSGWGRREGERYSWVRTWVGGGNADEAPKTTTHLEYGRDHGSDHQHKRKVKYLN